jgi:hypothetical protein
MTPQVESGLSRFLHHLRDSFEAIPGEELNSASIKPGMDTIAIQLYLVDPLAAAGRFLSKQSHLGWNESRQRTVASWRGHFRLRQGNGRCGDLSHGLSLH